MAQPLAVPAEVEAQHTETVAVLRRLRLCRALAGGAGSRRDATGSFAAPGADGRRGSFADVDRDTVATYVGSEEERRTASHRRVKRLLLEAGLDERAADADVTALHEGRVLVLVREA